MTENLKTMTPSEVDQVLAEHYNTQHRLRYFLDNAVEGAHRSVGDSKVTSWRPYAKTEEEVHAELQELVAKGGQKGTNAQYYLDRVKSLTEQLQASVDEAKPYDAEFTRRGGWSRFFLVDAVNGHIHASMHCSTCNKRGKATQFSWLPSVSGETEKAAVEEFGSRLCSVCFPTAPVEWTNYWELEAERKKNESCPGSGTSDWKDGEVRTGFAAGNGGVCGHCGNWAGNTSTYSRKIRKHKPTAKA